jgi:hypothetical protein
MDEHRLLHNRRAREFTLNSLLQTHTKRSSHIAKNMLKTFKIIAFGRRTENRSDAPCATPVHPQFAALACRPFRHGTHTCKPNDNRHVNTNNQEERSWLETRHVVAIPKLL